jgi:hypothetical protein
MKRPAMLLCLAGLCATGYLGAWGLQRPSLAQENAQEKTQDPPKDDRDAWMQVKLTSAQHILAHLTSGDFEKLQTSARRMQVMNILEQWNRDAEFTGKSEYQGQLNAFEFATKELIRHADDKDIDGALKSYVKLTESCVHCHKLIRDE